MKFATIGTSWITESFIEASRQTGAAQLYAVYSRSETSAKNFAEKYNATDWYTDLDNMLDGDADFVYVASPNRMHYEHTLKCIAKKKHVFCEKPMVYTEEQWAEIERQANKAGVYVFEGFRHLFSPNYDALKSHLVQAGKVRSGLLQYVQYSSKYDAYKSGDVPNVFSKEYAGGALMDLGVYPLSMAIDLFGEPRDIDYHPVLLDNGVDGSGTLVLTYGDFIVTILCSKIAQATIPSEIHGEDGTLTIDHIAPIQKLSFYNRKTKDQEVVVDQPLPLDMVYELEDFVRMIEQQDRKQHDKWMERSRLVAKWSALARKKQGILFPGE